MWLAILVSLAPLFSVHAETNRGHEEYSRPRPKAETASSTGLYEASNACSVVREGAPPAPIGGGTTPIPVPPEAPKFSKACGDFNCDVIEDAVTCKVELQTDDIISFITKTADGECRVKAAICSDLRKESRPLPDKFVKMDCVPKKILESTSGKKCGLIEPPPGTVGTLGGSGRIDGYFFNGTTCDFTTDLGSARPRGQFATISECEEAVRLKKCN